MKIKFIKDHKTGISIGRVVGVDELFGNRMIKEGYAEEVKDEPKKRTTKKKVESTESKTQSKTTTKVEKTTIENKKVEPVKEVKNVISTTPKRTRKTKKD